MMHDVCEVCGYMCPSLVMVTGVSPSPARMERGGRRATWRGKQWFSSPSV